ncbi:MAG: hypothetical protein QOJ29_2218 [Thermoleophilaceae bacterium]|nr:hypothetical protein [Thermoleophilaceae bacterium]
MKVLVVSSYGLLGGAELALLAFLEARPPGIDVDALLVSGGPLRAELERIDVPVEEAAGFEGRPGPGAIPRFGPVASRAIKRSQPDVIWALGQKAALLTVGVARVRRVPIVWHKVDFSWDKALGVPLAAAVNGAITVSGAVAEALGPLRRRRLLDTVGPPIALPAELRTQPDPARPAIGTLARLVPYKGHHHIIRAAAELAGEYPTLRVVLAGDAAPQYPDYPSGLRALADEVGLGQRVELPGFVAPEQVLGELTVFINATYRDEEGFGLEGLSGAMLEASWAGVPVVATSGGGTDEGVVPGETGTLVPSADPHLIATAVRAYLDDGALARRTGEHGMAFARERFSPEAGARRLFAALARAAGH